MQAGKIISALVSFVVPPGKLKALLLRLLGWDIESSARVGFSWVYCSRVSLSQGARIGHFNYIATDALVMKESSCIQNLNIIKGRLIVALLKHAAIGNFNKIKRAGVGVVWGRSIFKLGTYSKITSNHIIDCTRSVKFGDYSILAGAASQLWTHGYVHAAEGLARFRVDGSIVVGNNVYIGSACVINAAVKIANGITVGAATCVAKSLRKPGLYVGQGLRWVEYDYELIRARYPQVRTTSLIEAVHLKRDEQ